MKAARSDEGFAEAACEEEAPAGELSVLEIALAAEPAGERARDAQPRKIEGIVVGRVVEVGEGEDGEVRVSFPGAPDGVAARAMIDLGAADRGAEVALMFERGNPARPVVLGKMAVGFERGESAGERAAEAGSVTVTHDGERLVLSAEKEVVLQCGEASITLTRAGKVLLKGAYVSSRSTGVNRIQGGSVEIN